MHNRQVGVTIHLSKRWFSWYADWIGCKSSSIDAWRTRGLATGLVLGAVKRAVDDDGLYLHKLGHCVKIDPVRGNGLYLTPHKRLYGVAGDGLHLKRGSTIQD